MFAICSWFSDSDIGCFLYFCSQIKLTEKQGGGITAHNQYCLHLKDTKLHINSLFVAWTELSWSTGLRFPFSSLSQLFAMTWVLFKHCCSVSCIIISSSRVSVCVGCFFPDLICSLGCLHCRLLCLLVGKSVVAVTDFPNRFLTDYFALLDAVLRCSLWIQNLQYWTDVIIAVLNSPSILHCSVSRSWNENI